MKKGRNITKIELVFENETSATIEGKYIGFIYIDGIKRGYASARQLGNWIAAFEYQNCEAFKIILSKEIANAKLIEYGQGVFGNESLFNRILFISDIVSITLYYEDGTNEEINVPWKDRDEIGVENQYQKVYIDEENYCGDLIIQIAADHSVFNI